MEHSTGSNNDDDAANSHMDNDTNCGDDNETNLLAAVAAAAAAGGPLNLDHKSFKHLLDTQSLVDCTLACDGGKVSAHKGVLAACSSYLAKILLEHPVEHPIIILPELNIEDVKTLVHYMYTGELLRSDTIHSNSLLRTAAILCVNSLNDLNTTTTTCSSNYFTGIYNPITNSIQQVGSHNNNTNTNDHNTSTSINFNNSNLSSLNSMNNSINNSSSSSSSSGGGAANSNHHILNSTTLSSSSSNIISSGNHNGSKSEFQFKCPVCQNDFQTICSFEYHMQRIHNVTSFGCEICHKPFVSLRYVLTDHMRRCHGWKADQKLQC